MVPVQYDSSSLVSGKRFLVLFAYQLVSRASRGQICGLFTLMSQVVGQNSVPLLFTKK